MRWLVLLAATACRLGFESNGLDTNGVDGGSGSGDGGTPLVAARGLAASDNGACAILADNSLWCWGNNLNNALGPTLGVQAPTRIGSDVDWAQATPGLSHTCARKLDGSLWCWGDGSSGRLGSGDQMPRPSPARVGSDTDWSDVSSGYAGSCGIRGGGAYCWGLAAYGSLGDGSNTNALTPRAVASSAQFTDIASGAYHSCAIDVDGGLWCWGLGFYGQLGNGSSTQDNPVPLKIGTDTWQSITAGTYMTCGVKTDTTLWCWGLYISTTPRQIGTATGYRAAACGDTFDRTHHVCGLRGTDLWCAGINNRGDLGVGHTDDVPFDAPVQVEPGETFDLIAAGDGYTCTTRNEVIVCTGLSDEGQLGDGFAATANTPQAIPGMWTSFDTGYGYVSAISTDGTQWAWGRNGYEQLGPGHAMFHGTSTPTQTNPQTSWKSVSTSFHGSLALAVDTTMWRQGGQFYTQGGATLYDTPTSLESGSWTATAGGAFHDCGIQTDGSLWCWGDCDSGACGTGGTTSSATPVKISAMNVSYVKVSAGYDVSCAIRSTGTLWCWGQGGHLGDGTTMQRLSPTQIGTATNWTDVSIGGGRTCGIQSDASLWCWGGLVGDGTQTSALSPTKIGTASWAEVSAGTTQSCGVQTNGTLWCWGTNDDGELGDGTREPRYVPTQVGTATNWSTVRAGWGYTCARTMTNQLSCWGNNREGQLGNGTAWKTSFQAVVH